MDLKKIEKIFDLLEASDLAEVEIKEGDDSVRLSRFSQHATPAPAPTPAPVAPAPAAPQPATAPQPAEPSAPADSLPEGQPIKSPMVGTFYVAASPDDAPFVAVGQEIKQGDTVGVIEAMKMFNQIEAEISGKVVSVLVKDGQAVEFDQPLFIIA